MKATTTIATQSLTLVKPRSTLVEALESGELLPLLAGAVALERTPLALEAKLLISALTLLASEAKLDAAAELPAALALEAALAKLLNSAPRLEDWAATLLTTADAVVLVDTPEGVDAAMVGVTDVVIVVEPKAIVVATAEVPVETAPGREVLASAMMKGSEEFEAPETVTSSVNYFY